MLACAPISELPSNIMILGVPLDYILIIRTLVVCCKKTECTVCPGSSKPFYIVSYYIKWVTTSWIHSTMVLIIDGNSTFCVRAKGKQAFRSRSKCLEQIKLMISLQKGAPISELPSNISIMEFYNCESGLTGSDIRDKTGSGSK